MTIQAVTTWEGSVKGLEMLVEGAKQSGPYHESLGAKNPRLWRASAGGDIECAYYSIEFESHEAYGKFTDQMMKDDWWKGTVDWMDQNADDIVNCGTVVYYNAIQTTEKCISESPIEIADWFGLSKEQSLDLSLVSVFLFLGSENFRYTPNMAFAPVSRVTSHSDMAVLFVLGENQRVDWMGQFLLKVS